MTSLQAFYESVYQQPLLLALPSVAWLAYLLFKEQPRNALWKYGVAFTSLSILDAVVTSNAVLPSAGFVFVLLGDFRVFFLLQRKWIQAALLTLVVPIASHFLAPLVGSEPRHLFLTYEVLFLVFYAIFTAVTAGRAGFSDPVRLYPFAYYASWATADLCLLATAHQSPTAWILRIVANLLYYFGWTPWVHMHVRRLESGRSQAS